VSRSLAGLEIDTLEFAREGRSVVGTLALSSLPRLLEFVSESVVSMTTLNCELEGRRDGGHWLHLKVQGQFDLTCQRCLGPMPFTLDIDTELEVIPPGAPWPDEVLEDGAVSLGADAIAANEAMAVAELIEEEVLLALPIAPKHQEEDCVPPEGNDGKRAASPFAVLAQLKKH
jgi:uncharacterized protein